MQKLYESLIKTLKDENKEDSLKLCLSALENKDVSVVELYQSILGPALNSIIEEYDLQSRKLNMERACKK